MALTEMQKKIINDNPKATINELKEMAHCSRSTVIRYRELLKKTNNDTSVESVPKQSQNLACAHEQGESSIIDTLYQIRKSNLMLTPEDLFKLGTTVCAQEFAMYSLATAKLTTDPDNPKYLWTQKQHREGVERMVALMGKWHGMDRESVINNILQLNTKVNVVTSDKVAQFEQFIRENDPNAL